MSQWLAESPAISLLRIIALAVLIGWTTAARLVRGATLVTRQRDFVRAAQSLGAGTPHILWRHILPNVMAPLVVATTLSVGDIILLESVLSFLGLGVQPPLASWGSMLSNAEELITSSPLLAIYPGAEALRRAHEIAAAGHQRRATHQPRGGRPADQHREHHDADEADRRRIGKRVRNADLVEVERGEDDQQRQQRQRDDPVREAHQRAVGPAAEITSAEPHRGADRRRGERGGDADR